MGVSVFRALRALARKVRAHSKSSERAVTTLPRPLRASLSASVSRTLDDIDTLSWRPLREPRALAKVPRETSKRATSPHWPHGTTWSCTCSNNWT